MSPYQSAGHADILITETPAPRATYQSGCSVCTEGLQWGRWIGLAWNAAGFVEKEPNIEARAGRIDLPAQAFRLNIDGQDLHFGWDFVGGVVEEGPTGPHGIVELRHGARPITVGVHTCSDGTGIIWRWLEITNTGDQPAALSSVSPWAGVIGQTARWADTLGAEAAAFSVGYFREHRWANEGAFDWLGLSPGAFRIRSREGWSGHGAPFFVVRNEVTGEHIVGALAWSGDWVIELDFDPDPAETATLIFSAGPVSSAPMRVIAPGETIATPAVHLGYLGVDFDAAIQAFHAHLRRSVLQPYRESHSLLVTYNHWGYTSDEMTEEALYHEMDVAADIGAEMFIVDAGWFADRGKVWVEEVGDWDEGNRLPHGLDAAFQYARSKGLKCGLWVDIERIGRNSQAYREHPDWRVRVWDEVENTAINTAIPEAVAYMEQRLVDIIERYQLDLFRLDRNTRVYDNGVNRVRGYLENVAWRHYEAVNGLYERLRERFPRLIFENCAGGGGRTDLGMLQRFDYTWVTDWPQAPRTLRVMNGLTMALPPEKVACLVGVAMEGHQRGDLRFQLRAAMMGQFTLSGLYPAGTRGNEDQLATVKHAVSVYRKFLRPLLPTSRIYHHTPVLRGREPGGWAVIEEAAPDGSKAAVFVFRLAGPAEPEYHLRLRGVAAGRRYHVRFDNSGEAMEADGSDLLHAGLSLRLAKPLTSELLLVSAVD